jgi:hypothetical protein
MRRLSLTAFFLSAVGALPAFAQTTPDAGTPAVVHVTCPEDCAVTVDGRPGQREDYRRWTFTDVVPGLRRVEITGQLRRPLYSGYTTIPGGQESTWVAEGARLRLTGSKPLGDPPPPVPAPAPEATGVLHLRCDRPCTLEVDGQRRGANQQSHDVAALAPGKHQLRVTHPLNGSTAGEVEVPAGVEVFVVATGRELKVTTTRPITP